MIILMMLRICNAAARMLLMIMQTGRMVVIGVPMIFVVEERGDNDDYCHSSADEFKTSI